MQPIKVDNPTATPYEPEEFYKVGKSIKLDAEDLKVKDTKEKFPTFQFEGKIKQQLQVQSKKVSQVVVLEYPQDMARNFGGNKSVVAKIYDPAYYRGGRSTDPDWCHYVDNRSRTEMFAYYRLKSLQGKDLPVFYGVSQYRISTNKKETRNVRVLFFEYMENWKALDKQVESLLEENKITDALKKQLLARVIEIYRNIHALGVFHIDVLFQNFVSHYDDGEHPTCNIRIIDFELAFFSETEEDQHEANLSTRKFGDITDIKWQFIYSLQWNPEGESAYTTYFDSTIKLSASVGKGHYSSTDDEFTLVIPG